MGMIQEQQSFFGDENAEYEAFVGKFKPKKTTDDCYTPPPVYQAVADWVSSEYGVERERFVRPFYPGGDYVNHEYPEGCVVVDNPPFSILSGIIRFFCRRGIHFFLFAPTLTLFTAAECDICYIPCDTDITYENGAVVATSFVTDLDEARVRTATKLFRAVTEADKAARKARKDEKILPKYAWPQHLITAAMVGRWCRLGIEFRVGKGEAEYVRALDRMRERKKSIFGGGFLIGEKAAAEKAAAEKAAAEKAAAEVWELSAREWDIVERLG